MHESTLESYGDAVFLTTSPSNGGRPADLGASNRLEGSRLVLISLTLAVRIKRPDRCVSDKACEIRTPVMFKNWMPARGPNALGLRPTCVTVRGGACLAARWSATRSYGRGGGPGDLPLARSFMTAPGSLA